MWQQLADKSYVNLNTGVILTPPLVYFWDDEPVYSSDPNMMKNHGAQWVVLLKPPVGNEIVLFRGTDRDAARVFFTATLHRLLPDLNVPQSFGATA